MKKIGIYIPCYNVYSVIHKVLYSFTDEVLDNIDQIVVVDNLSTDQTLEVLKRIQDEDTKLAQQLVIIKNLDNYGLGGSQKIAYQYFIDNNFTHFMIIHGDNQGNGNQIASNFLEAFNKNKDVDLITASRFISDSNTSKYSNKRKLGNYFFNFITYILSGVKMSDSGAGILFYKTKFLKNMPFRHLTNSSQFNPQLNILMHKNQLKSIEIPLDWENSEEESSISSLNYCITLLRLLTYYWFARTILKRNDWNLFSNESQDLKPSYEIISK